MKHSSSVSAGNGADLIQRQLARQHDAFRPEPPPRTHIRRRDTVRLRRYMEFHIGEQFATERKHAEIRHDERVGCQFAEATQISGERGILRIARCGVDRHVDPHLPFVRVADGVGEFPVVKIIRGGPHTEGLAREIDRVRTVADRRLHLFKIPCRRKQFRPFSFKWFHVSSFLPPVGQ